MKKILACEKLLKRLSGQQSTVQAIQTPKLLGCFSCVGFISTKRRRSGNCESYSVGTSQP